MPSPVLIQKLGEQAESAGSSLGVRIVSVESRIDSILLTAARGDARASIATPFEFDVDLSESSRTEDSLSVRYAFTFGRPSCGQLCKISGKAVVKFSQFNPGRDFHTLGNDITNEMAVGIFRKIYEAAYLLHGAMSIEVPSPWITQDVSLSSRNQMFDGRAESP